MGKVEEHQDAINHRVTQCDQSVEAAPLKRIDQVLKKKLHKFAPRNFKAAGQGKKP
jgi:hypothetical protein